MVGRLAGVYPLVVDVERLREEVYGGLEVLHADGALDPARVPTLLHLDLAALLVVAERTVEHGVQRHDGLPLGTLGTLRLATAHLSNASLLDTPNNQQNNFCALFLTYSEVTCLYCLLGTRIS